jgi:hypothetical protein
VAVACLRVLCLCVCGVCVLCILHVYTRVGICLVCRLVLTDSNTRFVAVLIRQLASMFHRAHNTT